MFALLLSVAIAPPPEIAPAPRVANSFAKWEKDILAIEKRLAAHPPKPGAVFFSGSSSIVKWDLKKSFPDRDYLNVGFGGSVVADSTHFAPRILLPYRPGTIVFYAGDNDIASGRSAAQVLADFQAYVATIRKDNPNCRILFVAVKPSLSRWKKFEEIHKANSLVRELCERSEQLTFVDIEPLMLGADGQPIADLFVKDGLHLSAKGYELWTEAVNKVLK